MPELADWTRSTACSVGTCVEVRHVDGLIELRDTRQPDGRTLAIEPEDWAAFIAGVKNGEFDGPAAHIVQAPDVAAFASEMVARISMAPSKPLLPWPELPQDLAFLAVVIDRLRAGAQIMAAELELQGVDQAAADDIRRRAALLGTDTTSNEGAS